MESGSEFRCWTGERCPIGSAKYNPIVGISGDVPSVFVNKPVMEPAEQNQIVQIGGPTLGPVLDVVDLEPACVPTPDPLASPPVAVVDESSQPAGDGPAVSSHTDDDTAVGDDGFENTVTGESSRCFVGNESRVGQLGDTDGLRSQCVEVGEDSHLR